MLTRSARADDRANPVSGQTPVDATPMNCDNQTECFEFSDCRADRRTLQTTPRCDVRLCGRCCPVARIAEQAQPDGHLSRRQLLQRLVDKLIQQFESSGCPLRPALTSGVTAFRCVRRYGLL